MGGNVKSKYDWNDFPLSSKIKKSLYEQKFDKPTVIQAKALKASLIDNKNVFGAARTGSGKTLAYAIPIVQHILSQDPGYSANVKKLLCGSSDDCEDFDLQEYDGSCIEDLIIETKHPSKPDETAISCPDAIILVPTRELAVQVKDEIDNLCRYTDITTYCLIGGLNQDKQIRQLNKIKPHIVIATPGRLYEIVRSNETSHLDVLSVASIRSLTIDEADRMVQKGHFEEMLKIIEIINESKHIRAEQYPFNVYLFSATLTFLHELPERLKNPTLKKNKKATVDSSSHSKKGKILRMIKILGIPKQDTRIIDINNDTTFGRPSSSQLEEFKIHCEKQDKDLYLYHFLTMYKGSRTIIFCNSKDSLRRLVNVLKWLKIDCMKLHADMDQKKRLSSLESFRKKKDCIMISTDVAARGLDIKDLDCVVHYQVPKTCESYIHRCGRTARLDNHGRTLVLCEPSEIHLYKRLCSNINGGRDLADLDVDFNVKKKLKNLISLAQECDRLDHQIRSSKSERNWFLKASKECDIELDEDDMRHINGRGKVTQKDSAEDVAKRRKLDALSKVLERSLKST